MITTLHNILNLLIHYEKNNPKKIFNKKEITNLYDNINTILFTINQTNKLNLDIDISKVCSIGDFLFESLSEIEDIEIRIQEFIEALEKMLQTLTIVTNNNTAIDFIQPIQNEHVDFIKKLQESLSLIEKICLQHRTIQTPKTLIAQGHRYINNFEETNLKLNLHIISMHFYDKKDLETVKNMLQMVNMTFTTLAAIIRKVAFQFNYDHCD